MKKVWLIILLVIVILLLYFLIPKNNNEVGLKNTNNIFNNMKIESDAFENNGSIPVKYTCNGESERPTLRISGVPEGAKALALIVDDPDAPSGDFVHWVVWNIVPETTQILAEDKPGVEGKTSIGKPGYVTPCPPSGVHHYHFKLYALDTDLSIPESSDKANLLSAMEGHILDNTILTGLYGKGM